MFMFRVHDDSVACKYRYLSAERYMPGNFVKFNGNNGYVYNEDTNKARDSSMIMANQVAQAFSHWTYQYTLACQENVLVCDIQGDNYCYTDPTVCTMDPSPLYGKSNMRKKGFENFFRTHECNAICKSLKLSQKYVGPESVSAHRHLVADKLG
jgi:hypothetical protein